MDIMKLVLENEQYMVETRRYLHKHPEVSGFEVETTDWLDKELTRLGVEHVVVPRGGILGFIDSGKPGKTVMLRADVDSLPVTESEKNLKCQKVVISENKGVCQACGHDAHMAMLLAAAKILNEHKSEIKGKIVLMFERGEEYAGNVIFLRKYIEEHKIHIDSAYGNHVYAMLEAGKISMRPGPVMSGPVGFTCTIHGRGGHGSRPDQSVSPIDCFAAIYDAMNAFRMRKVSPFNSLTFSVGKLQAGEAANVIPDDLTFGGTARVFEMEDGYAFKEAMATIVKNICDVYGCTYDLALSGPSFAVKNDAECAIMAKDVVGKVIGTEHIEDCDPWMASESMGTNLALWPGVFALVGIKNDEKGTGAPHHNADFDVDEDVMKYGAASAVAYALGFLESNIDTAPRKFKGTMADASRACCQAQRHIDFLEGKVDDPGLKIADR